MDITVKRILRIMAGTFVLAVMSAAFATTANAQCFGKAEQLLAPSLFQPTVLSAPLKSVDSKAIRADRIADDSTGGQSIVGLWHVHYLGPFPPSGDLEAYQIFNAGGTEVHNPNTPTDGVCLGAWTQKGSSVKLTHRVWLYDPSGNFIGVGHLEAEISLGDKGTTQTGTLTMQIFDLAGNAITPLLPGTLSGERVSPN